MFWFMFERCQIQLLRIFYRRRLIGRKKIWYIVGHEIQGVSENVGQISDVNPVVYTSSNNSFLKMIPFHAATL